MRGDRTKKKNEYCFPVCMRVGTLKIKATSEEQARKLAKKWGENQKKNPQYITGTPEHFVADVESVFINKL